MEVIGGGRDRMASVNRIRAAEVAASEAEEAVAALSSLPDRGVRLRGAPGAP